jgi:hypothetical protein
METAMNSRAAAGHELVASEPAAQPIQPDLLAAHETYVEIEMWSRVRRTNTVLTVVVLCLAVLCGSSSLQSWRATQAVTDYRPVVVRVEKTGQAEALNYRAEAFDQLDDQTREQVQKYFLREFVINHFSRMRASVDERYGKSLYFLSPELRKRATDLELGPAGKIAKFVESQAPDVDIEFKDQSVAVALLETQTRPYKATVDFERVYFEPNTRQEIKREAWKATFNYTVMPKIPPNLWPHNPLGLMVTYYRTDGE